MSSRRFLDDQKTLARTNRELRTLGKELEKAHTDLRAFRQIVDVEHVMCSGCVDEFLDNFAADQGPRKRCKTEPAPESQEGLAEALEVANAELDNAEQELEAVNRECNRYNRLIVTKGAMCARCIDREGSDGSTDCSTSDLSSESGGDSSEDDTSDDESVDRPAAVSTKRKRADDDELDELYELQSENAELRRRVARFDDVVAVLHAEHRWQPCVDCVGDLKDTGTGHPCSGGCGAFQCFRCWQDDYDNGYYTQAADAMVQSFTCRRCI
jgi:hypothetical protein